MENNHQVESIKVFFILVSVLKQINNFNINKIIDLSVAKIF